MRKWMTWLLLGLLATSVPVCWVGCEEEDDDPEVDVTGFWRGESTEGFYTEVRLDLRQDEHGGIRGSAEALNIAGYPWGGNPCAGKVKRDELHLNVDLRDSDEEDHIEAEVEGNTMRGTWESVNAGTFQFTATRLLR